IWPSMEKKVFFRSSQTHRVKRSGDEHIYKHSGAMRRQMDVRPRGSGFGRLCLALLPLPLGLLHSAHVCRPSTASSPLSDSVGVL
ncbi:hypothetical protein FOZ62_020548, partial [Perkinsus olseni]